MIRTPGPLIEIRRILKDDGLLAVEVPGFVHTLLAQQGIALRVPGSNVDQKGHIAP
jgi:hypothetical protein